MVGSGKGHLPPVPPAAAGRLPAAREVSSSRISLPAARACRSRRATRCPGLVFPVSVWKAEYNADADRCALRRRPGRRLSLRRSGIVQERRPTHCGRWREYASVAARGVAQRLINRPQVNGSVSFLKSGWGGSHTFTIGGEYMSDRVVSPMRVRQSLQLRLDAQQRRADAGADSAGAERVEERSDDGGGFRRRHLAPHSARLTLSLGPAPRSLSTDPARAGGAGRGDSLPAIDPVLTFNNWGPRAGMTADLTGDGKTVLKLHYGKFWVYPSPLFTAAFNPNPPGLVQTYRWINDANGNGRWDPGEEGALSSVVGRQHLDPARSRRSTIPSSHQTSAYIERELAPDFGVRTGVVLNARRQPYGTINVAARSTRTRSPSRSAIRGRMAAPVPPTTERP